MKKRIFIISIVLLANFLLMGCEQLQIVIKTTSTTTTESMESTTTTVENTSTTVTELTTTTTEEETMTSDEDNLIRTIAEVKVNPVGEAYTTTGTVVGTTTEGALIYDENDFIYIYLGATPNVSVQDEVIVHGVTSFYGGAVQFGTGTSITKVDDGNESTFTSDELTGNELIPYVSDFSVGDYIKYTGILTLNGSYLNISITGTDLYLTLKTNDQSLGLMNRIGDTVTVEGFMLYISGYQNQYLNILVTNVTAQEVVSNDYFPLTILSVNDLHGYIEQDDSGMSGLSNMAYLINQIRNENTLDDVVLLGNGDMFQGTFISNMTEGKAVVDVMNAMGFDAMGLGNHEFDWGIDTILQYFDNDVTNGEADFPLLNANIYNNSDDSLLTVTGGDIFNSTILHKEGVDVGVISYVGDVYGSISYDKVENYYFDLNITDSVLQIGRTLKNSGADVIIVNIHGFDEGINQDIAVLRDNSGDYLVDAVITGHNHAYVDESIQRFGDVDMPVIQARSNGNYFGDITLNIDLNTMDVVSCTKSVIDINTAGTNYDTTVETIIDNYETELNNEALATAGETINSTGDLYNWVGNVMAKATGADVAVHNKGGIRDTGGITAGEEVTLKQLYSISPFDNNLILIEMTYDELQAVFSNSSLFYSVAPGVNLDSSQTYTVAVISYVYYNYAEVSRLQSDVDIDTGLYIRNILVEDIIQKDLLGETFSPISHPEASIELQYIN